MSDRLLPAAVLVVAVLALLVGTNADRIARKMAPLPVEPTFTEMDAQIRSLTRSVISHGLSRASQSTETVNGRYQPLSAVDPTGDELSQKLEIVETERRELLQTWNRDRVAAISAQHTISGRLQTGSLLVFLLVLSGAIALQLRRNREISPPPSFGSGTTESPPTVRNAVRLAGRVWGHAENTARSLAGAFSEGRDSSVKGSTSAQGKTDAP